MGLMIWRLWVQSLVGAIFLFCSSPSILAGSCDDLAGNDDLENLIDYLHGACVTVHLCDLNGLYSYSQGSNSFPNAFLKGPL